MNSERGPMIAIGIVASLLVTSSTLSIVYATNEKFKAWVNGLVGAEEEAAASTPAGPSEPPSCDPAKFPDHRELTFVDTNETGVWVKGNIYIYTTGNSRANYFKRIKKTLPTTDPGKVRKSNYSCKFGTVTDAGEAKL